MNISKIYFCDFKTKPDQNLIKKFEKLIISAGIDKIDFNNKFVAIKIHFGEPGNLAYIRPNYVRKLVEFIKSKGGKPFLTDSNTLYKGRRSNGVDHIEAAMENGFNVIATDCNVIIADGIKGTEFREVEINKKNIKKAKIGSAIADSDIIISVNHFKGHEMTGFGGAIKNIGMGSGSVGGKLEMHSSSQPKISEKACTGCGICAKSCSRNAISLNNKKAKIDADKCVGCGQCIAVCIFDAARVNWNEAIDTVNEKIAEYAFAVLKDKPSFHINFISNVSPDCDCWASNDIPIVPDVGILAGFDPLALDKACADLVNQQPVIKGSILEEKIEKLPKEDQESEIDKFSVLHPDTNWKAGIKYAKELGLGNIEYEITKVK